MLYNGRSWSKKTAQIDKDPKKSLSFTTRLCLVPNAKLIIFILSFDLTKLYGIVFLDLIVKGTSPQLIVLNGVNLKSI
jgi:hypothetical protein